MVDWRARMYQEAERHPDRARIILRVGWRLHCKQHRLAEAEEVAESIRSSMADDRQQWGLLTEVAANQLELPLGVAHG
jgi:hypothetical protein